MATKSIIEVDVNDARFVAFKKLHDAYTASLKAAPAAWAAANARMQQSNAIARQQLTVTQQLVRSIGQMPGQLARSAAGWGAIDRITLRIASSVGHITTSILRWGGIGGVLGGLLGLGGLFGIEDLAQGAAGRRRRALGLGTGFGGMQAFGGAFSRFVGPDFLEAVAGARMDVTQRVGLLGAGLNAGQIGAGDTTTTGVALLQQLKRIADTTNPALFAQVIQARRLGQFVSPEDLLRLRNTRPEEFQRQLIQQADFAKRLQIDDGTLRRWQDFTTALDFAGKMINKTFVVGLAPLATPLSHLSSAVTDVVASFLNAAKDRHWIDTLADALERFASYVATPEFDQGVKNFVDGITRAGQTLARWFGSGDSAASGAADPAGALKSNSRGVFGQEPANETEAKRNRWLNYLFGLGTSTPTNNPGNLRPPGAGGFMAFRTPEEGLRAMAAQLRRDENVHGQDTIRKIIGGNEKFPGYSNTDVAAYIANVSKRTGFGADQPLNLNDQATLSRLMAAMVAQEQRKGTFDKYKDPDAVLKTITVENNTGGNANVSINGLKN